MIRPNTFRTVLGISPAMATIGIFMLLPILIMALYSFLEPNPYGGVRWNFTVESYVRLLFERDLDGRLVFDTTYLGIIWRSVWIGAVAVVASLLVGFPVAYYIAIQPTSRRNILILLITIPFWTNLLIRTYCWILILRDTGLINNILISSGVLEHPLTLLYTNGAIILGLIYTFIPFMVLPIYASLEKLDHRLIEAARDLYATRWQAMKQVIIPLAIPGIVAGSLLVFIPSLGAYIAPDLLGGGKKLMLGSLVQLQFSSSRNWPFGSALAIFTMAIVMVALTWYALGPGRRSDGNLH
ncbi:MAG: ABC transporter permease [Blastopirellula sp.]|nr:MAG: ABC transporter permease [Blastopirellula sp.]